MGWEGVVASTLTIMALLAGRVGAMWVVVTMMCWDRRLLSSSVVMRCLGCPGFTVMTSAGGFVRVVDGKCGKKYSGVFIHVTDTVDEIDSDHPVEDAVV